MTLQLVCGRVWKGPVHYHDYMIDPATEMKPAHRFGSRLFLSAPAWAALLWCIIAGALLSGHADCAPPSIRVKEYGAKGDGNKDDTNAITPAVAAAAKGALYFPPGTYTITRPIDLPRTTVHIFGDGPKSVILQKSGNIGVFNILPGSKCRRESHESIEHPELC
jgi:hypothetical protein